LYSPCLYCIVFSTKNNVLLFFLHKNVIYSSYSESVQCFLNCYYISSSSWIHQELVSIPLTGLIPQPCCVCLRGVALVFVVVVVVYIGERFLLNWNRIVTYFHDRTSEKKSLVNDRYASMHYSKLNMEINITHMTSYSHFGHT
jgi:hypothetical protein